jgi:hypothetical protein
LRCDATTTSRSRSLRGASTQHRSSSNRSLTPPLVCSVPSQTSHEPTRARLRPEGPAHVWGRPPGAHDARAVGSPRRQRRWTSAPPRLARRAQLRVQREVAVLTARAAKWPRALASVSRDGHPNRHAINKRERSPLSRAPSVTAVSRLISTREARACRPSSGAAPYWSEVREWRSSRCAAPHPGRLSPRISMSLQGACGLVAVGLSSLLITPRVDAG